MPSLLEDLQARFDLVIVDAPALSVVPDAIPLLKAVGGVLVVARLGSITREQGRALHEQLAGLKGGAQWTIATAREHLSFEKADPWADYWTCRQTLTAAMKKLGFKPG